MAQQHNTSPVREAVAEDAPQLLDLELSCPQGSSLVIASHRKDYFFRAHLYGSGRVLVAEDREQKRLIGAVAGTIKEVLIGGHPFKGAFFYDLRVHPDYRRSLLGRHMLRAWEMLSRWAEEEGADLIYGLVKSDNTTMLPIQRKKKYRNAGTMVVIGRPVFRRFRLKAEPCLFDPGRDGSRIQKKVLERYGGYSFFPALFRDSSISREMEKSGLFSCLYLEDGDSFASLGLFRVNRTMGTRVLSLPGYYKVLKPLLDGAGKITPLPRIPGEGEEISYCHTFNHIAEGPQGIQLWKELLKWANNQGMEEGSTLLMSAFDISDPFLPLFARGSINRIDYTLSVLPLNDKVPEVLSPYYPDIRDMM
jgi:ribosomal protein S18 acetylase RimI-like enzyme